MLVVPISTTVTTAIVIAVPALAVTPVAVLRRVLLEPLILLAHIGQQILAEFLCHLHIIWIGTTAFDQFVVQIPKMEISYAT